MSAATPVAKMKPAGIAQDIEHGLRALLDPGQVFEIRVPKTRRCGTVSGYFDDPATAAKSIVTWNGTLGKVAGIYVTINPVDPRCHARAYNHLQERADNTTKDEEILRRSRLFVDIDADRPAGVSATQEEHDAAHVTASNLIGYLKPGLACAALCRFRQWRSDHVCDRSA